MNYPGVRVNAAAVLGMLALLVTLQSLLRPSSGLAMRGGGIDIGRALLDAALSSPLYKAVLVPQAQRTMVETAERNGVPWRDALDWIKARGPWRLSEDDSAVAIPEYYRRPFHAYELGNLCWDAAWEGEIASRAVGARNFPECGEHGEEAPAAAPLSTPLAPPDSSHPPPDPSHRSRRPIRPSAAPLTRRSPRSARSVRPAAPSSTSAAALASRLAGWPRRTRRRARSSASTCRLTSSPSAGGCWS